MPNLTSVGVTAGVPTSGTGTVSTLDAVLAVLPTALAAHGGLIVEGVASGVAVPVSGTLAATQSGTWTVQPGNTANTTAWKVDGSAVTQPVSGTVGITTNSAINVAQINGVTTTMGNGVSGTGVQRVSIASDSTGQVTLAAGANVIGHVIVDSGAGSNPSYSTTTSFTCGTTAYVANDCVGAASANAALDLGVLGSSAGITEIVSASLEIDAAAIISGETSYRLYLYNVTPPSAINDSSPWVGIASGDRASFLGYIDFAAPIALGSSPATLYVRQDNIGTRVKLSGTHLFGYLVTNGAYTPTARVFLITLHAQGV